MEIVLRYPKVIGLNLKTFLWCQQQIQESTDRVKYNPDYLLVSASYLYCHHWICSPLLGCLNRLVCISSGFFKNRFLCRKPVTSAKWDIQN